MTPEELTLAYQAQYGHLRDGTAAAAEATWIAYGGVTDEAADNFTRTAIATVSGAQQAVGSLVAGYFANTTREVLGRGDAASISPTSLTTAALRGVPALEVYRRPVIEARTALANRQPYEEAMRLGALRAVQLASTDIVLAQRQATLQAVSADQRIVGYRRVLTGQSCALCATASTQRYFRGDLNPIHVHCDCSVAPIYGTKDPGQVINSELLADLKRTGGPEYWKSHGFDVDEQGVIRRRHDIAVTDADGTRRRVTELGEPLKPGVRHHGELGPVLVDPADKFTGPDNLAA